ncbi:hypothetical protein P9279_21960 [Mesorhizobium sp. WSM4962]|uniref:hypothetical protein n=1 Tax=Mesorhizobium sp. WSM4962 TaxID=3038548 RepID=UPI002416DA5A|nr:hypothetical protein [Mesorhizobium sp. WSM4962]MDG4903178.1 hypothetical protein [Mesorhizobium sp. WSM4962]
MRSVTDMLAGIDPPMPKGCNSLGRLLADLSSHQCRFPLRGEGAATRFCAAEVEVEVWQPGKSGACYCGFHRTIARASRAELEAA